MCIRDSLKATREELDIQSIKDVVHYLVHARKIYVIGFRSSAPLAQFLAYYLSYIFENPQLITLGTSDIYSQLLHVTREDVEMCIRDRFWERCMARPPYLRPGRIFQLLREKQRESACSAPW